MIWLSVLNISDFMVSGCLNCLSCEEIGEGLDRVQPFRMVLLDTPCLSESLMKSQKLMRVIGK